MDGWVKKYRKETESQIWDHPPIYFKIWNWLLYAADYNTGKVKVTLGEISRAVAWTDNRKKIVPARATISRSLTLFEGMGMVEILSSNPIVIQITNYAAYQGKQEPYVEPEPIQTELDIVPDPPKKKPRKQPDPVVSDLLEHYKRVVDKDNSVGKARMYISSKYRRWKDSDIIKEAIESFKEDCDQDSWKKENQMYRGAEWFFHFKVDEYVKRIKAKQKVDPSPYREIPDDEYDRPSVTA
tara:strand:- start:1402 stop:2121 length:720 start_codon:yes stop_codon:yes gene_type:complete